jgi:hypothetical protein
MEDNEDMECQQSVMLIASELGALAQSIKRLLLLMRHFRGKAGLSGNADAV